MAWFLGISRLGFQQPQQPSAQRNRRVTFVHSASRSRGWGISAGKEYTISWICFVEWICLKTVYIWSYIYIYYISLHYRCCVLTWFLNFKCSLIHPYLRPDVLFIFTLFPDVPQIQGLIKSPVTLLTKSWAGVIKTTPLEASSALTGYVSKCRDLISPSSSKLRFWRVKSFFPWKFNEFVP